MQPSAQGIASLFMGNPGALQQKIQKEQQANPGLPPDLKKLMALNIVTNEADAAKQQAAINALNQMAPAGQEPPTVAQSIQEQAKQKMQAQMLQQMRQQQGLAELAKQQMGQIPENVPQPERQPQGIDELPVEFDMAGGGIVAFQNRGSVPEPTPEDLEKQRREDAKKLEAARNYLRSLGVGLSDAAIDAMIKTGAAGLDIATLIPRGLAGAVDTALIRPARAMGADVGYISPALTPGPQSPDTPTPFYDRYVRAREEAPAQTPAAPAKQKSETAPLMPPGSNEEMVLPKQIRAPARVARPPRPAPAPVAQAPAQQLMPPGVNEEMVLPEQTMNPIAMARADATRREKEFEERVGRPDYTAIDRLMAELERQKAATVGPERGFAGLMEFLGQIAATPRGLSSMEAGAMGARGVQALEREREARRSGLIEKQIALEQKKIDSNRQYAKDVFGVGTNEFDRMLKANMDMFKEKGEDNRLALRHAHDKTMADIRLENDLKVENVRAKNQAANRPIDWVAKLVDAERRNDTKEVERITKALGLYQGAKRPGLDLELVKKFQKTNERTLSLIEAKLSSKKLSPDKQAELKTEIDAMVQAAKGFGIDPNDIPVLNVALRKTAPADDILGKADKIVGG
jgi:hypothetical protein